MELTRAALLDHLTEAIIGLRRPEPTLVAIDGRSAAGKTTLADNLASYLRAAGRPALRCELDDFHPPGHKHRRATRPYTPETYYSEGYDYAAFQQHVLDPLQPSGTRRCRLAVWDSYHDAPLPQQWTKVPEDAIVVVDGIFLLRPEFRPFWHYAIWLHIDWETMVARGAARDVAWVGSAEVVTERYRTFWIPTHALYETTTQPQRVADVVVDNRRPDGPSLIEPAHLKP